MKFFSVLMCKPEHAAEQLTHQIYHSGIWYLPILSFSICLQSLLKIPGSSREVIRAVTYLFLGTCVHHVFLTKCGRVTVSLLSLTVFVSLYPGGSHVYFISPGPSSCREKARQIGCLSPCHSSMTEPSPPLLTHLPHLYTRTSLPDSSSC